MPFEGRWQLGFPQLSLDCRVGTGVQTHRRLPPHQCPSCCHCAGKHSPFSQAFLWGRAGPAHRGGPVQNQRAKGQLHIHVSQRQKQSLVPTLSPGLWLTLPAANLWAAPGQSTEPAALSEGGDRNPPARSRCKY